MTRPDPDQESVLESKAKHILVTAPPGTGKTFLTIQLAKRLAPQLPRNARVLVLTFSNQARTQLEREAARELSPELRKLIEVTNYHRFFWQAVSSYRRALGLPMELDIGSRQRRVNAFCQAIEMEDLEALKKKPRVLDALAEYEYPEFHDARTPRAELLQVLLRVVRAEQLSGRLVFDDLGALFWGLLTRFPSVDLAYRKQFPVVIADEHQDASELQDAVIRRLGKRRLVVLADQMQLIHGFRGATDERLERHKADCARHFSLSTLHRWHGNEHLTTWLLSVRRSLRGKLCSPLPTPPSELTMELTSPLHGRNAVKSKVKYSITKAFDSGYQSIAVLSLTNDYVAELRNYLCRKKLFPRQVGGTDFEEARADIELLPLLHEPQSLAGRAVDRIEQLIPSLGKSAFGQARRRLKKEAVNLKRVGKSAGVILRPLEKLYSEGPFRYFEALAEVITAAEDEGHHAPRREALRAIRRTADMTAGEDLTFDEAISHYSQEVVAASHMAPRAERGLYIMTAHQAKGKEFECVILADVSERFFPDKLESRRLFYVALTRGTQAWVIIAPESGSSPLLNYVL